MTYIRGMTGISYDYHTAEPSESHSILYPGVSELLGDVPKGLWFWIWGAATGAFSRFSRRGVGSCTERISRRPASRSPARTFPASIFSWRIPRHQPGTCSTAWASGRDPKHRGDRAP